MNITCQNCKTKLNIPDHKIPEDRDATVKCPKCKEKIRIQGARSDSQPVENFEAPASPLAFEERQSAMVCLGKDELKQSVSSVLRQMGFSIEFSPDTKSALKDMEYHIYNLVVVDETFDNGAGLSKIIARMNSMDMSSRRRICLLLISSTQKSNDNMAALHASVNSIINYQDVTYLGTFLLKILTDHKNFYNVYNESLKQAGKA